MFTPITQAWRRLEDKRPGTAQFVMFLLLSNGVTVLQLALMPIFKGLFNQTALVDTSFQVLQVGTQLGGVPYFIFDYPAGELPLGGGGLAYFLAVQITIGIAQIINFVAQRNITFKATNSVGKAAAWYLVAYILITFGAAAAQGLYKAPIYNLFMETWGLGSTGETLADIVTMIINSAIAFWIFFPIFKVIFRQDPVPAEADGTATETESQTETAPQTETETGADPSGTRSL